MMKYATLEALASVATVLRTQHTPCPSVYTLCNVGLAADLHVNRDRFVPAPVTDRLRKHSLVELFASKLPLRTSTSSKHGTLIDLSTM